MRYVGWRITLKGRDCRNRLCGFSRGLLFEVCGLPLPALPSRVPSVDIRSAVPPVKETNPFYSSAAWLTLLAAIIKERGRVCEDPKHAFNRTHRLKNALPDASSLGRIYGDHIIELRDGGAPLDKSNIMLRCAVCHGRKTASEAMRRRSTNSKSNRAPILR